MRRREREAAQRHDSDDEMYMENLIKGQAIVAKDGQLQVSRARDISLLALQKSQLSSASTDWLMTSQKVLST